MGVISFVRCDLCWEELSSIPNVSHEHALDEAQENGWWVLSEEEIYCPECREEAAREKRSLA